MSDLVPVDLHPYQREAVDFIKANKRCGLFFDMGLGKSLITLSALYELNPNYNILIIAPKNIARSTWIQEIKKWQLPLRYFSFVVDENDKPLNKAKRQKAYADCLERTKKGEPAIYFINRELVVDLIQSIPWIFGFVILDESQSFKNYQSKRFKALRQVSNNIDRLILLTGTPSPNGLMDLWSQIYLLDGGARLGRTITSYRNTFFDVKKIINGYPVSWKPRPGAKTEIFNRLQNLVISAENNNLKLPDIVYDDVPVYLGVKASKLYAEMEDEFVVWLEDNPVTAPNAAVMIQKLSQIASGALYKPDDETGESKKSKVPEYSRLDDAKCEMTASIIENTSSPVLVAYHFRSDLDMLQNYFKKKKIDYKVFDGSSKMVDDWNAQKIPALLIQPASAGHGLNLQHGGHTLIWYTLPWSLEEYLQCNARLYRQGQTHPVIIHHLLAQRSKVRETDDALNEIHWSATVDYRILKALNSKSNEQNDLIKAVAFDLKENYNAR